MQPYFFFFGNPVFNYGLMVILGIIVSFITFKRLHPEKDFFTNKELLLYLITVLWAGLFGARALGIAIVYLKGVRYSDMVHYLLYSGSTFIGGAFSAILAFILLLKIHKKPLLKTIDIFIPYLSLGTVFGRIGCWLNGCCYGIKYDGIFSVVFPGHLHPVFPVQILSGFINLVIFFILLILYKKKSFDGEILFSYILMYSIYRFLIEFLRGDLWRGMWFGGKISTSQILCICLFLIFLPLFIYFKNSPRNNDF